MVFVRLSVCSIMGTKDPFHQLVDQLPRTSLRPLSQLCKLGSPGSDFSFPRVSVPSRSLRIRVILGHLLQPGPRVSTAAGAEQAEAGFCPEGPQPEERQEHPGAGGRVPTGCSPEWARAQSGAAGTPAVPHTPLRPEVLVPQGSARCPWEFRERLREKAAGRQGIWADDGTA